MTLHLVLLDMSKVFHSIKRSPNWTYAAHHRSRWTTYHGKKGLKVNKNKIENYIQWKRCKLVGTLLDTEKDIKRRKILAINAAKNLHRFFENDKLTIKLKLKLSQIKIFTRKRKSLNGRKKSRWDDWSGSGKWREHRKRFRPRLHWGKGLRPTTREAQNHLDFQSKRKPKRNEPFLAWCWEPRNWEL